MNDYSTALNVYFDNLSNEIEQYKINPYNYKYSQGVCYQSGFSEFCNIIQERYSNKFKIKKLYETMSGNSKHVEPYIVLKFYNNKIQDGLYLYIKLPSEPNQRCVKISLELGRSQRYSDDKESYLLNLSKIYNCFRYNIEEYKRKLEDCSNVTSLGENNNLLEVYIFDFKKLDNVLEIFYELYITIINYLHVTDWDDSWENVQSRLFGDSYIALKEQNTESEISLESKKNKYNINNDKFDELKRNYLIDFDEYIPEELYKWKAIKIFNENWNLNVSNYEFPKMIEKSLKSSYNILTSNYYYPYGMILSFSEKDPDAVRSMFEVLFDETKNLYDRIKFFSEKSDNLIDKYFEGNKSHYQDMHTISTYLGFKYPEKYYLFKSSTNKKALKYVGVEINDSDKIKELINYFDICNEIHERLITDERIIKSINSKLDDDCYKSDKYHILTWDFLYYSGSVYLKNKEEKMTNEEKLLSKNIIFYGGPGCGKSKYVEDTYCKDDNYIRTTFYPDYTNSDFVGQLVPKYNVKKEKLEYVINPGPFTRALKKAYENTNVNIYLIIEEINRGNAAAIFGDIFQLLDRNTKSSDKPIGESTYEINNNIIEEYLGIKKVKIPDNLSIIATMNTSDQNVYTLDSAFKRRWDMVYISNGFNDKKIYDNIIGNKYVPMKNIDIIWKDFIEVINDCIVNIDTYGIHSEDKQIGKYFVGEFDLLDTKIEECENSDDAIKKFSEKVLMYIWEDIAKLDPKRWFNEEIKTFNRLLEEYKRNGIDVFSLEVKEKLKEKVNETSEEKSKLEDGSTR